MLLQVGDSESEAGSGGLEGDRRSRVRRRSVGPLAVQRPGLDGRRRRRRRRRRHVLQLEAASDGDLHAVRRMPLLLLVVPGPVQGGTEVPRDLLQRRPHLPHQLPPGGGAEPRPPAPPLRVAPQVQTSHRDGAVLGKQQLAPPQLESIAISINILHIAGGGGIRRRVPGHVLVRGATRTSLRLLLHSPHPDPCRSHRHIASPHAASIGKVQIKHMHLQSSFHFTDPLRLFGNEAFWGLLW